MYFLWPPTVGPEADAIVTKSCYDLKAQYKTYLACAKHINEVVKALTTATNLPTNLSSVDARQIAWRRMVEVCKLNTP